MTSTVHNSQGPSLIHRSSFDIRTARDFLHKLIIPQHEEFDCKNSSSRHALLTILLAYHMYEWANRKPFSEEHFRRTYPNDGAIEPKFQLARLIANGTKHFQPRANTRVQAGFSSDFSDEFERPLVIESSDGEDIPVDCFLRDLVQFWQHQESIGAF